MEPRSPETERGDLVPGEPHPAARDAMRWLRSIDALQNVDVVLSIEALASSAIGGNRLGEVCLETWRRLQDGEPVSDRYLLGLAWTIREIMEGRR